MQNLGIARGSTLGPNHRRRTSEIDPTTLQPSLVIPASSISVALKSSAGERATIESYFNNSAVEGVWAEFYHNGNWYMVSVSHVDVPARAKPEELDTIADEFLWQQGQARRKRRYV